MKSATTAKLVATGKVAPSIIAVAFGQVRSIRGRDLAVRVRLVDALWTVSRPRSQRMGDVFHEQGRVLVEVSGLCLDSQTVTVQVWRMDQSVQTLYLCAGETLVLDPLGAAAVEPTGWIRRLSRDVRAAQQSNRRDTRQAVRQLQGSSEWF